MIPKLGRPAPLPPPLRSEEEIVATWQTMEPPLVSVCCATYNHALYIRDALQGFLAQVTTFPFEIIVRDDASTDATADIVREYARQYPKIIKIVVESENQFRHGIRPLHAWPSLANGEFVALCEGDDYWIHAEKLQMQIELLKKYPESVMSVANTLAYRMEHGQLRFTGTFGAQGKVLQGFEEVRGNYFHTSTLVIRRPILTEVVGKYFEDQSIFGDTALQAILVSYGPFALYPEFVSVYRETGYGIWSSLRRSEQLQGEINVSKKLMRIMSGEHRGHQKAKLRALYRLKFEEALKGGRTIEWVKLLPWQIWLELIKVYANFRRRLNRLFRIR